MTTEQKVRAKSKGHTRYTLADGTQVPGTTTITGVMDKPALVAWANRLGLQGIETGKYVDELATIGTLAHYQIECWITQTIPVLDDYTPNQIQAAEICVKKFHEWVASKNLQPSAFALSEAKLVSEKHRYGGMVDIAAMVDNKATLIDIKTCKGIYSDHKTQVAGGYHLLCEENGYSCEQVLILRIGRAETEGFEQVWVSPGEIELHRKRFLICKELYELNRAIDRK
jgi:hypothetical protein